MDRRDAGRRLVPLLPALDDPLVLGLPRGGVPVAAEIATALDAPLDVFVVRKLGVPVQPELAMGAIASGGVRVLNDDVLLEARIDASVLEAVTVRERRELEARERLYRGGRPPLELAARSLLLVDDGLATGASMRAAVAAARALGAARTVVAVPVAPRETVAAFARDGIEIVCPVVPEPFLAVGIWYVDFTPVGDDEVQALLRQES